jgi:hypothetical protein
MLPIFICLGVVLYCCSVLAFDVVFSDKFVNPDNGAFAAFVWPLTLITWGMTATFKVFAR